ncbi:MAG: hypothetical protein Q8O82_05895 [Pseudorhodobacter sp.]|nr:hypothetical protein [Pseudorhodobacter sp.]
MIVAAFQTAAEGIAREQALLTEARPAVLLWQAQDDTIVVPEAWLRRDTVCAIKPGLNRSGWPLLPRGSGGGAVPQGPCTLNLALILPLLPSTRIEDGYRLICGAVSEALIRFEIATGTGAVAGAFCDGAWNVTAGGRKLAGTAQRWRSTPDGRIALLHASILLTPPPETVWPALAALHRAAGLTQAPLLPEAHVALSQLLPETMRAPAFPGALARAAEDRLSRALTEKQRAA